MILLRNTRRGFTISMSFKRIKGAKLKKRKYRRVLHDIKTIKKKIFTSKMRQHLGWVCFGDESKIKLCRTGSRKNELGQAITRFQANELKTTTIENWKSFYKTGTGQKTTFKDYSRAKVGKRKRSPLGAFKIAYEDETVVPTSKQYQMGTNKKGKKWVVNGHFADNQRVSQQGFLTMGQVNLRFIRGYYPHVNLEGSWKPIFIRYLNWNHHSRDIELWGFKAPKGGKLWKRSYMSCLKKITG